MVQSFFPMLNCGSLTSLMTQAAINVPADDCAYLASDRIEAVVFIPDGTAELILTFSLDREA